MQKKEVPQDKGLYGQWHGICYAVDEDGKYVLSQTDGWEPANIANRQAWELLEQEIGEVLKKVKKGELSPLAYHMAKNLMDVKMLAQYAGLPRWRVKQHMKPRIFRHLDPAIIHRYASVFNIQPEQIMDIP